MTKAKNILMTIKNLSELGQVITCIELTAEREQL